MNKKLIDKSLSEQVLMIGVYYKNNAPGGIAAVIRSYEHYIEGLNYLVSAKWSNFVVKASYALYAYIRLWQLLISDNKIKIVHLHTSSDASFWRKSLYLHLAKGHHRKVIMHIHASRFKDFYENSKRKENIVRNLKTADRLIVLSESWRDYFVSIGVDAGKIIVLHNITDYPIIVKERRDDKTTKFLFLGEIGERKGVFDILRGIAQHKSELNGKIVLKIGGNRNEGMLQKTIHDNGLEDMVKFEGWVAGEKKRELLNWADVFILPSFNEGLPISILEAMSYGCPIISTPVGGIPEIVADGKNGTLVTPGNAEEIVSAMLRYVDHPDKIETEGERSKEVVRTYLPDFVMEQLKEVYGTLLKAEKE